MSEILDLAIIGSGPAALTAALYAARAGLKVKVFERAEIGGTLPQIIHVSNYPGFTGSGQNLAATMRAQAEQAGAEIEYGECVGIKLGLQSAQFSLTIDDSQVSAQKVLIATGSEPRPLNLELSTPVSYCALCDVDLVHGKNIAVVGGGNSAVQESIALAKLCRHLTLFSHSDLKCQQCLRENLEKLNNVTVKENTAIAAEVLNQFDRVFVFIGKQPATGFLKDLKVEGLLDQDGYIIVNENFQTVIPGLYAAGDVCSGVLRQIITAAAAGAIVGTNL